MSASHQQHETITDQPRNRCPKVPVTAVPVWYDRPGIRVAVKRTSTLSGSILEHSKQHCPSTLPSPSPGPLLLCLVSAIRAPARRKPPVPTSSLAMHVRTQVLVAGLGQGCQTASKVLVSSCLPFSVLIAFRFAAS